MRQFQNLMNSLREAKTEVDHQVHSLDEAESSLHQIDSDHIPHKVQNAYESLMGEVEEAKSNLEDLGEAMTELIDKIVDYEG